MPTFESSIQYEHGLPESAGVLLVNLGTPDAPTTSAVRRYLRQFLWDRRVVEYPRLLWWLILNGVILLIRPARSAHAYQAVWTERGSPLLVNSTDVAAGVAARLAALLSVRLPVEVAMTYGNPSISAGLDRLQAAGARKVLVLPLFPQYSSTTTAAAFDAVAAALRNRRWIPELRFVNDYHDAADFIAAQVAGIRDFWQQHGKSERLVFSFHGLPKRNVTMGDPYYCQCLKTARLIATALQLDESAWVVAFQSRVGREEWLQPYTDELLADFGRQGMARVDVVCPGFAVDCLETLEEIAMRYAALFTQSGGGTLNYIPALNARDEHVAFLARLAQDNLSGWETAADAAQLADTRRRALAAGAPR